jgi:hypothetical protein
MKAELIGQLSLSLSFLFYCLYFLPQIWHNRRPENARTISNWLQLTYVLGYCSDWLYGAAAHLEWQYRCVTLIGILALCYQQWQMRPRLPSNKAHYRRLSTLVAMMVASALIGSLYLPARQPQMVNSLGTLSMLCSIFAFVPQLVRNYQHKNGQAISHAFIAITLICACLDMVSAIFLHWPWPSLVGPPALFLLHLACWLQQAHYRRPGMAEARSTSPQPCTASCP